MSVFGVAPHGGKRVHLRVGHDKDIYGTNGDAIEVKWSAVYLGALPDTPGGDRSEDTCRLGEATGSFNKLPAVWARAGVYRRRKVEIFNACAVTKLLFSLETTACTAATFARLDAFQAKCLRRILKLAQSYTSRISNEAARRREGAQPLSKQLH